MDFQGRIGLEVIEISFPEYVRVTYYVDTLTAWILFILPAFLFGFI